RVPAHPLVPKHASESPDVHAPPPSSSDPLSGWASPVDDGSPFEHPSATRTIIDHRITTPSSLSKPRKYSTCNVGNTERIRLPKSNPAADQSAPRHRAPSRASVDPTDSNRTRAATSRCEKSHCWIHEQSRSFDHPA